MLSSAFDTGIRMRVYGSIDHRLNRDEYSPVKHVFIILKHRQKATLGLIYDLVLILKIVRQTGVVTRREVRKIPV